MDRSALLIIDVQNDFCPGGSLPVADGNAVVPVINTIVSLFPVAAATQDWHPADHISFASNHPGKGMLETVHTGGMEQILWPDHCVQNTRGAEFHPDFDLSPVNLILRKGTFSGLDSYSAFLENDNTTSTGLCGYLTSLGIERIFLTGLAEDVCVYATALDGLNLGFEVFIVADAVRGVDIPKGSLAAVREKMKQAGIVYRSSAEL